MKDNNDSALYVTAFIIGLWIMLCSLYAHGELVPCTHKNGSTVTITSGPHKGKSGTITLREQYLGEMHHKIEITEIVSVTEEEIAAGDANNVSTPEEKTKRLIGEDKAR